LDEEKVVAWMGLGNIFVLILSGCGIAGSQYIDYTPDTPTKAAAPDCPEGLAAYKQHVAKAVDDTCSSSSCHASTRLGSGNLVKGEDAANRSTLLSYSDTDGASLFKKISSDTDHGGKDQSKTLPLEEIKAWRDVEATCPK
jgi:hypothetical protein